MLDRSDGNHKLIARIFGWLFSLSRSTPDSAGRITTTGKSCFPLPSATASVGVSRGGMDMPRGFGVTQIFRFLKAHQNQVKDKWFQLTLSALAGWHRVVTSIRHAAVHRISHDRKTLLKMLRVAVKFSRRIAGFRDTKSLSHSRVREDSAVRVRPADSPAKANGSPKGFFM
jgi:hypothetical protein